MTAASTLAILAGGGPLPYTVAKAAQRSGRDIFVVALDGWADPALDEFPHVRIRVSRAAEIIKAMRDRGCGELVLIGTVKRPDRWVHDVGLSLLWRALKNADLLWAGDSRMLSKIVTVFEREGFVVRGAHEVAPEIVLPMGTHTHAAPGPRDEEDIEVGAAAALGLGALDIGQGVVAARRRVLTAEAAEGTDAMLERAGTLNRRGKSGRIGVLVKCPQPIQDLRVDMPTIGPDTVRLAADAGLAGIAVSAGKVQAVDIDKTIATADELGLFLVARDFGGGEGR